MLWENDFIPISAYTVIVQRMYGAIRDCCAHAQELLSQISLYTNHSTLAPSTSSPRAANFSKEEWDY